MHIYVSRLFPLFALLGVSLSQSNLDESVTSIPSCVLECSLQVLTAANCSVAEIRECFCTSFTLQSNVALCVMKSCNATNQYSSMANARNDVCAGVPQESRSDELFRSGIILSAITLPFVVLRFISRISVAQRVWWDDWAILASIIFMLASNAIPIYASFHGLGKHFYNISPQNMIMICKLLYTCQVAYVIHQTLPKISMLLLYLRIFPSPRFACITKLAIAWMICHTLVFLFIVIFQCTPISLLWSQTTAAGKCLDRMTIVYIGAGLSIAEDLVIMFLPIHELKTLNLPRRKRIAICFVFALGSFACVTSIVRLKYVVNSFTSIDIAWNSVPVFIWSEIETYFSVICSCLICIRPLLFKLFPSLFQPSQANGSKLSSHGMTNFSWARKIGSKIRMSETGHEVLEEENSIRNGNGSRNGESCKKIMVITETTASFETKNIAAVGHG